MLNALKFVRGAVAVKDYQPVLTHFRIHEGRVTGYNGVIALSSPIDLDLSATPKAIPFVKAIERCKHETTAVHITPGGKLGLRSGGFKVFVDCAEDSEILDSIQPEGDPGPIFAAEFLDALKYLQSFIGNDASRPWATGVLLKGMSAFATNNIIVAEYWLGYELPSLNLPAVAVAELLRINEVPTHSQVSKNSITFFFQNDRWMRCQLLNADWPDVTPILNVEAQPASFPENFFEAVETLAPFVSEEGRIYFRAGQMTTSVEDGAGAAIEIEGLPETGAFNYKYLLSLRDYVDSIDFTKHPKPCPFYGPRLRGVILGMVDA